MKIVAKCYSLQPLSFEFKDNLCNSIPLSKVLMSCIKQYLMGYIHCFVFK